jgi:hypothetical protein
MITKWKEASLQISESYLAMKVLPVGTIDGLVNPLTQPTMANKHRILAIMVRSKQARM